jgi:hypothetical protein
MLIPSIGIGLWTIVLAAVLLAADWQIWDPRYRIFRPWGPSLAPRPGTEVNSKTHRWSATDGELVAALAPQALHRNVVAGQVQRGWMDHCSQG